MHILKNIIIKKLKLYLFNKLKNDTPNPNFSKKRGKKEKKMFWGTVVHPSRPVVVVPKASLLITNCALGLGGDEHKGKRVVVHCVIVSEEEEGVKEVRERDVVVCVLRCGVKEHSKMDVVMEAGTLLKFYIEGPVEAHLTGYYVKSFLEEEADGEEKEGEEKEEKGEDKEKEEDDDNVDISVFYREEYRDPLGFGDVADEDDEKDGPVETYNEDVEKKEESKNEIVEEEKNEVTEEKKEKKKKRKRRNKKGKKGSNPEEPPSKKPKQQQQKEQKKEEEQQKKEEEQQQKQKQPTVYKTTGKMFYGKDGKLVGVEACGDLAAPRKVGSDITVCDSVIGAGPRLFKNAKITLTYAVQQKGGEQETVEKRTFVFGHDTMSDQDLYTGISGMHAGGRRIIIKGKGEKAYDVLLTMVK